MVNQVMPRNAVNKMDKEPIDGRLEKIKAELEELKNKKPQIVAAIAEADLMEFKRKCKYHAAKEQQAQLESRVIAINICC